MRKLIISGCTVLLTILPGRVQGQEPAFLAESARQLNSYATLCVRNGFPRRARETWLEIISEYDADDVVARRNLGYRPIGTSWERIAGFEFPDRDEPNVSAARLLQKRWEEMAEDLGAGHRELAVNLRTAGQQDRAAYHFDRTLRFLPGDPTASEFHGLESFEGFYGTLTELELLKRSRLMERAITRLTEQEFEVESLPADETHPWVERGGVEHRGVRSENFTIWGNWEEDQLREAAVYCERALAFCELAFAGYEGFPPGGRIPSNHLYLTDDASWEAVVRANGDRLGPSLDFVLEFTKNTTLGGGLNQLHIAGYGDLDIVFDVAVRWVVEDYSGLKTDALTEGIGHAVVGMFFGRNLVYTVAPEELQFTVSGQREHRPLTPDLATWAERTTESAWEKTGTSAARLPLIKASAFPEDGRLKAWSFSDYLLRRDPALLQALDRTAQEGTRSDGQVMAKFEEATGLSLRDLDEDWRRFWTEDTPLNRAVHNKKTPLEAVSRAAPAWLEAFNELREGQGMQRVGWSSALSVECKQHAEYLKANRRQRGLEVENSQEPGLEGFSGAGRSFAQTAIVSTRGNNPGRIMENWMDLPGYRNAILNRELRNIGLFVEGSVMVMDVERGLRSSGRSRVAIYPGPLNDQQTPAPASMDVSLLGEEMAAFLRRRLGRGRGEIGYPISIHFYGGLPGERDSVLCTVTVNGELVEGFLHKAHQSGNRRAGAVGMLVFYPAAPLRRGVEIKVVWSYTGEGGRSERVEYTFLAN